MNSLEGKQIMDLDTHRNKFVYDLLSLVVGIVSWHNVVNDLTHFILRYQII
jgi:hypothetical protein